jgi:glycosyltransferase involved in cell wall biosynthesis
MNQKKIGLLLVNGPLPPPYGGVATYLAHALPFLAGKGFSVHTVIDRSPPQPREYDAFLQAGIQIHYGSGTRLEKVGRVLRHLPLWFSSDFESAGSLFLRLQLAKSIVSWLDVSERVVRSEQIDIIHAYDYPWVQGFVAASLARKYNKKYIQTTFGEVVPHREELIQHDEFGDRYKAFVRHVLSQADRIISLSQHCASEVEHVGVSRENVRVTYWGVDTKHFHPSVDGRKIRNEFALGDDPVVLFVGQVRLRKGPQVLLEAAPAILREHSRARIFIVGPDYGIVDQLKRRAHELGVEKNVIFAGGKSHAELPAFYAACNVFVFPTCTPIECLGLSMIQAMACGKPVVGSRINGIPEVIVDGETGFLVDPGNPVPLAEKVAYLLSNEEKSRAMGAAGRRRAEEKFDQDRLVRELEEIYHEVITKA